MNTPAMVFYFLFLILPQFTHEPNSQILPKLGPLDDALLALFIS